MIKVLSFGTFDFLHPGHEFYLGQAKKFGDYLITVIARDANVLKIKGKLPYHNENIRFQNLKNLNIADEVVLGDLNDPFKVILDYKPSIIAFGYDQNSFNNPKLNDFLEKNNLKIKLVRIESLKSEQYKSSIIRKNLGV